ncbi:PCI domain-containing protein [Methanocaldococcus sp.]|uniref:PCI domain-containing protein n=1 Tax=Methanocaldococcus sp. TaxID=2152917 RepID=UPI002611231C|nr:PCI domain-containing protein [Methanocaldococcus sp.]MCQ6254305.1 PCI domain-containing protein [Methanocaldococcus sp.]
MRYVAYKIYPEEFLKNEVVENSLIIEGRKVRRVRILGKVENINVGEILSFYVDGVNVKYFEDKPVYIKEGDIVDVIGRPRTFNGDKYLMAEIIKVRDEKWIKLRDLEIKKTRKYLLENAELADDEDKEEEFEEDIEIENLDPEVIKEKILSLIEKFGEITFEELSGMVKLSEEDLEKYLSELIESGEILEPIPGVYKIQ